MIELSVIIPTRRRHEPLVRCLRALARQTLASDRFEVVVVLDGEDGATKSALAGLSTTLALRVLTVHHGGQGRARNLGVELARGAFLLFLDDDVVADPALLATHLGHLTDHPSHVTQGHLTQEAPDAADWYARAHADAWNRYFRELVSRPLSGADVFSGNVAMARVVFDEAGGFAEELSEGEDAELGYRLQRAGRELVLLPGARATHADDQPLERLIRKAEAQGRASAVLGRRHRRALEDAAALHHGGQRPARALADALLGLARDTRAIDLVGRALPGGRGARSWQALVHGHYYRRGARQGHERARAGDWDSFSRGTPILMYHAFSRDPDDRGRYVVAGERFERQMAWLRRRGFRGIGLEDYARLRHQGRLPPARTVVLTIDDGYRDALTVALPILRRHGFTATVYPVTDHVGARNGWDRGGHLAGRALLSWDELRAWSEAGMSVGVHSRTHRPLTSLSPGVVALELTGARDTIEGELGVRPTTVAYPHGEVDRTVVEATASAGFLAGCSVEPGLNHPATSTLALRRAEITGTDGLGRFVFKVRTGMNGRWLGYKLRQAGLRR